MHRLRPAIVLALLLILPELLVGQLSWEPANAGLEGGGIQAFAETDGGDVIASTSRAIYRHDRSADRWEPAFRGYGRTPLHFALAPDGTIFGVADPGLRSSDGGRTWIAMDSSLYDAAPDPSGNLLLFDPRGRSTDLGMTWTPASVPYRAGIVNLGGGVLVSCRFGVTISRDTGSSWAPVEEAPGDLVAIEHVGRLLVAAGRNGVWRSADSGASWQRSSELAAYDIELAADGSLLLSTAGLAGRAGSGLYRSLDTGSSWGRIASGGFRLVHAMRDGELWTGRHPGPARSIDGGERWTTSSAGIHERRADLLVDPTGSFYALASVDRFIGSYNYDHRELYHSSDDGGTWRRVLDSVDRVELLFPGCLVAVTAHDRDSTVGTAVDWATRLSTDHGATWRTISRYAFRHTAADGGAVADNDGSVAAIALSPEATNNLLVTTDRGATWTPRRTPATPVDIAITPFGRIVVGTSMNTIVASDDRGATWTTLTERRRIISIVAPTDRDIVAVTFERSDTTVRYDRSSDRGATWTSVRAVNNYGPIEYHDGTLLVAVLVDGSVELDRSTDHGSTWTRSPVGPISLQHLRPTHSPTGAILAMRTDGLVRSLDLGASFELIDTVRWPQNPITNGRVILVSGGDTSIFRARLNAAAIEPTPRTVIALRIAPVPATKRIIVDAGSLTGTLRIVDVAGRIVHSTMVDGHAVVVDVSSFVPGSYVARVSSDSDVAVGRFVVVRE